MRTKAIKTALKIAIPYLIVGIAYITFSDSIVSELSNDEAVLTQLQTYKGWGFIIVTTLILLLSLIKYFNRLEHKNEVLINTQDILKVSEEKFRTLVEGINEVFYISDGQGKIKYCSPNSIKELGYYDSGDIIGKSYLRLVAPVDRRMVVDHYLSEANRGVNITKLEFRVIRKDKTIIWGEQITNIVRNDLGDVIEYRNVARAITDRKMAEESLRISSEKFKAYFDSSSVGLSVTGPDKSWIEVNQKLCDMMGYSKDELTNVSWLDLTHPEDIESNFEMFEKVLDGKLDSYSLDKRFIRKGGEIIYVTISTTAQRNNDGSLNHFLTSYLDITERKYNEEKIKESELKFRLVWEKSTDGMRITDEKGIIILVNDAYCQLIGLPFDQVNQQPMAIAYGKDEYSENMQNYFDNFRSCMVPNHLETNVTLWNGKKIYLEISNVFLEIKDQPTLLLSVFRDTTENKLVEEKLRALTARLEKIREEERIYLSRDLHDNLGQNLTGLKMEIAYFAKKIKTERFSNPDDLLQKSNSMLSIIDEMINKVRKISAELRPNVLDYLGLIPAIEWQIGELMKRSEIKATLKTDINKIDLGILTNSSIFRILQEAFTNIIRHAQATNVVVSINEDNESYILEILDNGIGIKEEDISDVKSLGIIGMNERTFQFNGKLTLQNAPQGGTLLTLIIPKMEK